MREGHNLDSLRSMVKRIRRARPLAPLFVVRTGTCESVDSMAAADLARRRVSSFRLVRRTPTPQSGLAASGQLSVAAAHVYLQSCARTCWLNGVLHWVCLRAASERPWPSLPLIMHDVRVSSHLWGLPSGPARHRQ